MFITKKLIIFILLTLTFTLFTKSQKVEVRAVDAEIKPLDQIVLAKKLDPEAQILQKYLSKYNSPMQYHAQDFIDAARTYNIDWKLLPAIAGVESTFGKFIPGGYNAYGWAIYNSNSRFGFESWRDGMFVVAKGLRENYLNKGLTDPYSMNRIYAASPTWGSKVSYFLADITKFEKSYIPEPDSKQIGALPNIAAISGQIDFN